MTLHCLASVPRALNAKLTYREATVRNRLLLLSLLNLSKKGDNTEIAQIIKIIIYYTLPCVKWSQCVASGYNSLI